MSLTPELGAGSAGMLLLEGPGVPEKDSILLNDYVNTATLALTRSTTNRSFSDLMLIQQKEVCAADTNQILVLLLEGPGVSEKDSILLNEPTWTV
ncbi:hypothetical protein P3T76_011004 [Phytophthora citrophthora]|uniref:Uncharacterized protein n=1 Tax=Phytophthora citrophthora TaxID=4793 RepID=A0AAD9G9S8_9STRA|nr:hypothetical protein P3T76_011004 [Phytophthora citrophthora]